MYRNYNQEENVYSSKIIDNGNYVDEDGRFLVESSRRQPSSCSTRMRVCPYEGARNKVNNAKLMNISALRRLNATRSSSFGLFLRIREFYINSGRVICDSYKNLWRFGILFESLPAYLVMRSGSSIQSDSVPRSVADAFKFSLGINSVFLELGIREAVGASSLLPPMDAGSLVSFADRMLIGRDQVCAAPASLIEETFRAYLEGAVSFPTQIVDLTDLIDDLDNFLCFGHLVADFRVARALVRSCLESFAGDRASDHLSSGAGEDPRLPSLTGVKRVFSEADPADRGKLLREFIRLLVSSKHAGILERAFSEREEDIASAQLRAGSADGRAPGGRRGCRTAGSAVICRHLALRTSAVRALSVFEWRVRRSLGVGAAQVGIPAEVADSVLGPDLFAAS